MPRGTLVVMASGSNARPWTIGEALAQLKRDPAHPVRAEVDHLKVELRVVPDTSTDQPLGDFLADGGGWKGESFEEITRILREGLTQRGFMMADGSNKAPTRRGKRT